jgi:hypothetical protein
MEAEKGRCLILPWKSDRIADAKDAEYVHDRDAKTRKLIAELLGKSEIQDRNHVTKGFDRKLPGNHVLTDVKANSCRWLLFVLNMTVPVDEKIAYWRNNLPHELGKYRRIFTGAEEATIADVIGENYISLHRRFANEDFIALTIDYWLMKFADDEKAPFFNCSPGFMRACKNRNRLSSRRQHFKRRSAASPEAQSRWRVWLSALLETLPTDYILNCDETMWRLYAHSILKWVKTSADDVSI